MTHRTVGGVALSLATIYMIYASDTSLLQLLLKSVDLSHAHAQSALPWSLSGQLEMAAH